MKSMIRCFVPASRLSLLHCARVSGRLDQNGLVKAERHNQCPPLEAGLPPIVSEERDIRSLRSTAIAGSNGESRQKSV